MRTAGQIPAALDALSHLAWLNDLGWIAFSKAGHLLVRSVVDATVGSPERLIFEASPLIGAGVAMDHIPATLSQSGAFLTPPVLTDEDRQRALLFIAQAKHEAAPEAARIKDADREDRAGTLAQRTGVSIGRARKMVNEMMEGATLADDFQIQTGSGDWITIGQILDAPDTWDKRGIPDPIEGIEYGAVPK